MRQAAADADEPSPDPLLHDLHNLQVVPDHQRRANALTRRCWVTKHLQNDGHIGFEAIHRKQDRLTGLRRRDLESFTLGEALVVGAAQALALAPGVSRSGITLTAALLLGLNRQAAARFSFLLSMPVILGAVLFQFLKLAKGGGFQGQELAFALGILVSAVTGLLAIRMLLGYLQRNSLILFVGYRLAAGALVLLLVLAWR